MFPQCCCSCFTCVRVCNFSMQTDHLMSLSLDFNRGVPFRSLSECHEMRTTHENRVCELFLMIRGDEWNETKFVVCSWERDERGSLQCNETVRTKKAESVDCNLRRQLNQWRRNASRWSLQDTLWEFFVSQTNKVFISSFPADFWRCQLWVSAEI